MSLPIAELLAAHPLPPADGDKSDRGTAVIAAGSPGCPGAAILAAIAALRAGAGRVRLLTHPDLTTAIGIAVPEALVVPLPSADAHDPSVADRVGPASALLVGPGLERDAPAVASRLAAHLEPTVPLLLDARALSAAEDLAGRGLVLLPNVDEAGRLVGSTAEPQADPTGVACQLATSLGATVAVRGTESVVTNGDRTWTSSGHPGLGTAGSGDVLAGLVVGLIARGVCPLPALGWAVSVHAAAGALASTGGPGYGYLARELLDVVPEAIAALSGASAEAAP